MLSHLQAVNTANAEYDTPLTLTCYKAPPPDPGMDSYFASVAAAAARNTANTASNASTKKQRQRPPNAAAEPCRACMQLLLQVGALGNPPLELQTSAMARARFTVHGGGKFVNMSVWLADRLLRCAAVRACAALPEGSTTVTIDVSVGTVFNY
jgi:hypothetical protein